MSASRFEQAATLFGQFRSYLWKKLESKTAQNISSAIGGIATGSTIYYVFGGYLSAGILWPVTILSAGFATGYTKWKLYKAHETEMHVQLIVPMQTILYEQKEEVHLLKKENNDHKNQKQKTDHKLLQLENAIELLAMDAPSAKREQIKLILHPPEDKDEELLEGTIIEQIIEDGKSTYNRYAARDPRIGGIPWDQRSIFFQPRHDAKRESSTLDVVALEIDDTTDTLTEKTSLLDHSHH